MKIEYDSQRDLLYIWFAEPGTRSARTDTITPGVHADFDNMEKLVGIEVLDAAEVLGRKVRIELDLTTAIPA